MWITETSSYSPAVKKEPLIRICFLSPWTRLRKRRTGKRPCWALAVRLMTRQWKSNSNGKKVGENLRASGFLFSSLAVLCRVVPMCRRPTIYSHFSSCRLVDEVTFLTVNSDKKNKREVIQLIALLLLVEPKLTIFFLCAKKLPLSCCPAVIKG